MMIDDDYDDDDDYRNVQAANNLAQATRRH